MTPSYDDSERTDDNQRTEQSRDTEKDARRDRKTGVALASVSRTLRFNYRIDCTGRTVSLEVGDSRGTVCFPFTARRAPTRMCSNETLLQQGA